jgi:hypothetical protein
MLKRCLWRLTEKRQKARRRQRIAPACSFFVFEFKMIREEQKSPTSLGNDPCAGAFVR